MSAGAAITRAHLLVGAVLAVIVFTPPPRAAANLPLGSTARTEPGVTCEGEPADRFATGTGPRSYTVRGAGTITSWMTRAGSAGGSISFKVFRPAADGSYTVVALDGPRSLIPSARNGFASSIVVQAGDVIGLNDNGAPSSCVFAGGGNFALFQRTGNLGIGQTGAFFNVGATGVVPNLMAVIDPSNEFSFTLRRKGRKGAVKLEATLPGPGRLVLSSRRLKAPKTLTVSSAGEFERVLAPKPKTRRLLRKRPRLNAKVEVAYAPSGGAANIQDDKVRLRRR